ncbi:hypothetical protein MPS01_23700 [Marinilactibacillus psychrotolerans]|nr:hypothetical protein MPS01_23700 [Marinilactibacillus psychrotolerans]
MFMQAKGARLIIRNFYSKHDCLPIQKGSFPVEKMMQENLAMQWLTGQTLVSYRALNRFRVSEKN